MRALAAAGQRAAACQRAAALASYAELRAARADELGTDRHQSSGSCKRCCCGPTPRRDGR